MIDYRASRLEWDPQLHLALRDIAKKGARPGLFDRILNLGDSPRDVPRAFIRPKAGESNLGRMGTMNSVWGPHKVASLLGSKSE